MDKSHPVEGDVFNFLSDFGGKREMFLNVFKLGVQPNLKISSIIFGGRVVDGVLPNLIFFLPIIRGGPFFFCDM